VLALVVVAFVFQLLGWAWVGVGLRRVREGAPLAEDEGGEPAAVPVSVVVAAHDEAERLPALLRALEHQAHRDADGRPLFEVVVVDDRSADGTAAVVEGWARQWAKLERGPDLRLVRVEPGEPEAAGLPPKKHALERGAEAARHARLAFTDADGRPPPTWLATLARWAAEQGAEPDRQPDATAPSEDAGAVLVGYGPLEAAPGWLGRFARYETVQTAALAAAGVGWDKPWHAVGRNLSYPASLLARLGGFEHSAGSLSGDDDLLVQEVARRGAAPVRYVWDAAAAVPSAAPAFWRAFWRQKRRHAGAGAHYPLGVLIALGVLHTSNLALWIGAPVLHLATGLPYGWGLLAVKLVVQRAVLLPAFDALGAEMDLHVWQPVLDAVSGVYHAALAALGALPAPRRW
jgi:glycosyltransferase involved in cell wall biosynthesis